MNRKSQPEFTIYELRKAFKAGLKTRKSSPKAENTYVNLVNELRKKRRTNA